MILGQRDITRVRRAAATIGANYKPVPGAETLTTIRGAVQPLNGDGLEQMPEGERTRETRKVYTTSELRTARPDAPADHVIVDGVRYEVQGVERQPAILPHYKAYLTRVGT